MRARTMAAAKLHPRLSSPRPVPRTQIIDQLRAAEKAALVLVHGPAGFGKSTVMLQYYAQLRSRGIPCGWLTLDNADNDLSRFLEYLAEVLRAIGLASHAEGIDADAALPDLAARLAALGGRFVLFLDDFETIDSPAVLGLLRQLVEYLPESGQIVIGSRTVPDLGLGRLRVHGLLLEIQAVDLRFSSTETALFLRQQRGLALRNDDILRLQQRTQGWPAALWLVSLALRDHADPQKFVDTFDGSNASIADYLMEDVLARQSPLVRDFVLRVSVLEEFNAQLSDAVLERSDSGELLACVAREHLFLVPQDSEHRWFRFHPLFRDFLRAQIARVATGEVPHLHRRAAQWWMAKGRPTAAIEHALQGDNSAYLMKLLETHAPKLLWQGRSRTLARWWDQPQVAQPVLAELAVQAALAMVFAWALILTHRREEAQNLLDALDAVQDAGAISSGVPYTSATRPPRAFLLAMSDRIESASQLWRSSYEDLTPVDPFTFAMRGASYGLCLLAEGRFEPARQSLTEAQDTAQSISGSFIAPMVMCVLGVLEMTQGRLRNATASFRAALTGAGSGRPQRDTVAAAFLADALYQGDHLEEAEHMLNLYLPLLRTAAAPDQLITSYVVLARIASARGEHEVAEARLAEMELTGHRAGLPRVVASARMERARLALLQGRVGFACDQLASDYAVWSEFAGLITQANDVDSPFIDALRLKIRTGRAESVVTPLKDALREAQAQHRFRRAHQLSLLLVEALWLTGQAAQGMRRLRDALQFAADEGFVRNFVDEGPELLRRVAELRDVMEPGDPLALHADRILIAAGLAPPRETAPVVAAPESMLAGAGRLSERESQVLRLLADGYRNREIADRLFISETTVKAHLRSINVKLGAQSRTHAVAMGRQLGLVA